MTMEHAPRLAYTDDSHIELAPRPHVDDIAVDTLAAQQKARMAEKRAQGFNGWDDPRRCSVEKLSMLMAQSMCKGKVVDVANFAAMLHSRGAPPELVGEHAMRSLLRGAREHRAWVASQLRVVLADDGYACTFQTMGQYRTALLKTFDTVAATEEPTPQACTHCGGSGRQEDVFEQAENPVYALGEELVKAQTPDADPRAVDTLIEALDSTLREHGFTVAPAEAEQADEEAPTANAVGLDGQLCEHCGEGHTVLTFERGHFACNCDTCSADCQDFAVERLNALLAASAAAEAQGMTQPGEYLPRVEAKKWQEPDLYWFGDHEHGYECPDDAAIVGGRKLGERYTLNAAWYAPVMFEITKVPDSTSDDYEIKRVEPTEEEAAQSCQPEGAGVSADYQRGYEDGQADAHSRQAQGGALSEATQEYTLRAMARNYANGHAWDKLDAETCTAAADEIRNLRAILARAASEPRAEGLRPDEVGLFSRTIEEFEDCNESSTPYDVLLDWARRGLLECTQLEITDKGRAALAASKEGA